MARDVDRRKWNFNGDPTRLQRQAVVNIKICVAFYVVVPHAFKSRAEVPRDLSVKLRRIAQWGRHALCEATRKTRGVRSVWRVMFQKSPRTRGRNDLTIACVEFDDRHTAKTTRKARERHDRKDPTGKIDGDSWLGHISPSLGVYAVQRCGAAQQTALA